MHTLAQSLHMNTMYLNSAAFCPLLIMNVYNRAFGECVKSFQDYEFVFIGCTKSSVIRYYNTCVY